MTKLLEQGIRAVQQLPAERQDMAGELLLKLAARESQYGLMRETSPAPSTPDVNP